MVLNGNNFEDLPEKEQVYRLRKLADAALEKFGFNQYRLTLLQHLVNTTFRLDCDRGRFLVRIHRARSRTAVASELAWLEALVHETTVSVQIPQRSLDGKMIVVGEQIGMPAPYPVTVLSWLEGQILPQDHRSPHHFYRLGQLVAKLHHHAQHWTPAFELDRPLYDSTSVLRTDNIFGEEAVTYKQLPEDVQEYLRRLHEQLQEVEQRFGKSPDQFGLIHSDLSFGNVLFTTEAVLPIDFDDCGFGYYLYDLAVILAGPWERPGFQQRCNALLHGYREICELPDEHLSLIPTLMAMRASSLGQWDRVKTLLHTSYVDL
ncbi:phosphotransferase [Candidatus Poribacteria bacterium]|nr:phosphotransferase [Candidatus Poribacteria bacterium]